MCALNQPFPYSCACVCQIRHATVERLLDRLTDARFLSIDFLNTFLLTYRVFTTGITVIMSLRNVLANPELEGAAGLAFQQLKATVEEDVGQSTENRYRLTAYLNEKCFVA